jgi:hypothetical protein
MTAFPSRAMAWTARVLRPALLISLAATLGGCVVVSSSGHGHRPDRGAGAVLSPRGQVVTPTVVQVGISAAGTPVVTQEPVVITPAFKGPITWRLPPDSGLTFADNGIVIEGQITRPTDAELKAFGERGKPEQYTVVLDKKQSVITGCRRVSPIEFACSNTGTPGRFAYTVRLLRDGQPLEPLDPTVVNLP